MIVWTECRDMNLPDIQALLKANNNINLIPVLTASQLNKLNQLTDDIRVQNSVVIVPNFLHYARLLSTGQFKSFLLSPGRIGSIFKGLFSIGLRVLKNPLGAAKQDFWTVAQVLLSFDLSQIPSNFQGTFLLHDSIGDFAWIFDRPEIIESLLQKYNHGNIGVITQQPFKASSLLARLGCKNISIVTTLTQTNLSHPATKLLIETTKNNGWKWINNVSEFPVSIQSDTNYTTAGIDGVLRSAQ